MDSIIETQRKLHEERERLIDIIVKEVSGKITFHSTVLDTL